MPTAMSIIAAPTERCAPTSRATRWATAAPPIVQSAIGANARPASVGENPSTFCMYSEVKK